MGKGSQLSHCQCPINVLVYKQALNTSLDCHTERTRTLNIQCFFSDKMLGVDGLVCLVAAESCAATQKVHFHRAGASDCNMFIPLHWETPSEVNF